MALEREVPRPVLQLELTLLIIATAYQELIPRLNGKALAPLGIPAAARASQARSFACSHTSASPDLNSRFADARARAWQFHVNSLLNLSAVCC